MLSRLSQQFVDELIRGAESSPRRRQHLNLHGSFLDPTQRLLNAICHDSYIRPHRHFSGSSAESLFAIRGRLLALEFDEEGGLKDAFEFGPPDSGACMSFGLEVPASTWHTVVALDPVAVVLEVKAGPFQPELAKELATWAPAEGSAESVVYLERLRNVIRVA